MYVEPIASPTGYYGKIPATGDFIKYNLPRAFIEPWDDWLQTVLTFGRESMGAQWLEAYLTSPIYRFVLTPGICGESGWKGVVMPSVDRVGRYFPMTISKPIDSTANPFRHLLDHQDWFAKTEDLILSILENSLGVSDLNLALAELDKTDISHTDIAELATNSQIESSDHLAVREPLSENIPTGELYQTLLNTVLLETGFAYSLWSTKGSETVSPSLLTSQGLPPTKSVNAMLDGNWSRWGWLDNHTPITVINTVDTVEKDPWDR
jgi:type VI secretion system protein ImpM